MLQRKKAIIADQMPEQNVQNVCNSSSQTDAVDFQGQAAHEKSWAVRNRYMLQRKKAIIADQMPEKKDQVVFCELSPLQVRAYKCAFMFVCVDTSTVHHSPMGTLRNVGGRRSALRAVAAADARMQVGPV